jgi:hypothetical protein
VTWLVLAIVAAWLRVQRLVTSVVHGQRLAGGDNRDEMRSSRATREV